MEDISQIHWWWKKIKNWNLWEKKLLAESTERKSGRSQRIPNSMGMVQIQHYDSIPYLRVLTFFFFSYHISCQSVNHLMIFWLRAKGNLFTTTLNDFISENYLITWYVLSLPIWVLGDLSKKLERLEGTWRKCVGSCKGKMKVSHKCPFVECECTTNVLLNMKLECDHDVSINAHTQCFKGVWVLETVVETRLFWFSLKHSKIRKCKTKNTVLILFSIEWWKLQ